MQVRTGGGILAIVGGVGGVLATVFSLAQLEHVHALANPAEEDRLIWGALMLAYWVVVLGATALNAYPRLPGILIVVSGAAAAVCAGTLVAPFMVLAIAGGVLCAIGKRPM